MDKRDIIPGYKGVMPLDIVRIDPKHRKQAISEHFNDIKLYTQYQNELSPRLRYENTIGKTNYIHKKDQDALVKRLYDANRVQMMNDARLAELDHR